MDRFADMLSSPRQAVSVEKVNPQNAAKAISKSKITKSDTQVAQIKKSLKNIFIFEGLDISQMNEMIDYMFKKDVTNEEVIIKENESGDNFYVIEKGLYEAYKGEKLLKTYDNSGFFGELALLYNTPRNATIKAKSSGVLWCLDRDSFRRIVLQHAYEKRSKFEDIIKNIALFKSLEECERMMIPDALTFKTIVNEQIMKEGENNDKVYIIESGEVQIIKTVGGKQVVKKTLKSGFFGEETILFNRPSSFSVKTTGKTSLGIIESQTFKEIITSVTTKFKTNCETFIKSIS